VPEFYLVPKRLARKAPALVAAARRLEAWLFRTVFWLVRRLSVERACQLAGWVFGMASYGSDKAKKAHENLAIAFPEQTQAWREQTTKKIFHSLGISAAELIKLDQIWAERDQRIEFVLEPEARKHMESGRPTIFVTAHIGAWQVAVLVTRQFGFDICTIYAPESNPVMNELMFDLRQSFGEKLIAADVGPRPLMKELKAGRSIVMATDTRPETGKLIPFFGRDALSSTSAAGLALRTGAALVTARAERLPNARYRITVYDPLVSPIPDAPVKEQAVALTQMLHHYYEDWIRQYPEQWVCLKRRWPKAHKL
jgi:KDO2-lipid IV(A) lauroyltransferase